MRIRVKIEDRVKAFECLTIHRDEDIQGADQLLQWDDYLRVWRIVMVAGRYEDHYRLKGLRGDLASFTWNELKDQVYDSCLVIIKGGEDE